MNFERTLFEQTTYPDPLHSISISFVELNQSHLSRQISVSFVVTHVSFVETISISFVEIFRSLKDEIE
jgi:hypothetical protein